MKTVGRLWEQLITLKPLKASILIFTIAFVVRIAFIFYFHTYLDRSRTELERTAISLATTGVFGNPYAVPTGPTGHVAPGYTLILAALFRLLGTGVLAETVKQVSAAAVPSLLFGLLPQVAQALRIDKRAGVLAGLVSAIYPARPVVETKGDWETPYTALILALLLVLTMRLWNKPRWFTREALRQGLAWGISLLFVPALLLVFFSYLAAGWFFRGQISMRRYLRFVLVEVATAAICLAPWVIRNYWSLGSPVITRTNFGMELRISNNDDATADQRENYLSGVFSKYHPLLNKNEALKVRELGEVAYNKEASKQAREWIRTHPKRFLELSLGRARCFWLYYDPTSLTKTAFLGVTVLLGWAGCVTVLRRDAVAGTAIILILLIYPLPNYLVHIGLRQEYPIHWLMMLLAAAFVLQGFMKRAMRSETD